MAQDPEPEEGEFEEIDSSPDLDLVTLFSSSAIDSEMEANTIKGMLEANGIPAVVVGASTIPSLEFQVQVPRAALDDARQLMSESAAEEPAE